MVIHNSLQVWVAMSEQLKIVRCYQGGMYRVYWCVQVIDFAQYLWDKLFVLSDILCEWRTLKISSGFKSMRVASATKRWKVTANLFPSASSLKHFHLLILEGPHVPPDNCLAFLFLSVPDTNASDFSPAYCGYSISSIEIVWRPQTNFTKVSRQELHGIDSWALSVCFRL